MTATVHLFPGHHMHHCSDDDCMVCRGGLGYCTTCGGAEGTLPTDCPQEHMSLDLSMQVYEGLLDFIGGRWVDHDVSRPHRRRAIQMGYPDVNPREINHINCRCTLLPVDPDVV